MLTWHSGNHLRDTFATPCAVPNQAANRWLGRVALEAPQHSPLEDTQLLQPLHCCGAGPFPQQWLTAYNGAFCRLVCVSRAHVVGGEGSLSGKELTSSQPPRPDFERVINLDGFAACLHLQEIHMPACYVALWGGGEGGGRAIGAAGVPRLVTGSRNGESEQGGEWRRKLTIAWQG